MSVKNTMQSGLPQSIELVKLKDRERMIVHLFRMLDDVSQGDIIRFVNVLVRNK